MPKDPLQRSGFGALRGEAMYDWREKWTAVLSPKSMRTLSTPLALYYKSYLAVAIGSTLADKVIRYSYAFSARMDEATTAGVREESEDDLQQTLSSFFYPTLGILRGLVKAGFSEEEAEELVTDMIGFAPAELRTRISFHL